MGAKTWMLVYSDGDQKEVLRSKPKLDRDATVAFASRLFPDEKLKLLEDGNLSSTCPPDNELVVGCFPGVRIVAGKEFAINYPSKLPAHFLDCAGHQNLYLHAMHSVVDWFAYAIWNDGDLRRSLSLSPDYGLLEDIGARMPFEDPYWAGAHADIDPDQGDISYPFVFHPLELGEAALLDLFGYQLEGTSGAPQLDPENITLMRFKRSKSWWRWR